MAKALTYVADAALIAGAVALTVTTGGGGLWAGFALMNGMTLTPGAVAALATTMGAMGAGSLMSAVGAAISGGGVSTAFSVKSPSANRVTIYGQTRVNGTVIYSSSIGHTINQVVAWASHPCKSVDFDYLDGREIYFYGNGHNAVAGASGWDDDASHYDASGNKWDFGGSGGGNFHVYIQHCLGSYAGAGLPALRNGALPPHGDHTFHVDSNWPATATLNGICASLVATAYNANMFSNIPQVKAAIRGKCDIYDPRINATLNADGTPPAAACGWTDNAALIIADFLTDTDYGFGYTWSEIDIPALIAAANVCDTPVPLATGKLGSWSARTIYTIGQTILDSNGRQQTVQGYYNNGTATATTGGSAPAWNTAQAGITYDNQIIWCAGALGDALTEKMYTINGTVDWGTAPGDTLSQMLEAIGGPQCLTSWDGKIKIVPAAWYGATTALTAGDLFGGVKIKERKSRDLCNAVRAKFICPSYPYAVTGYDKNHKDSAIFDGQYQPVDAPEYACDALHGYASDVYLAQDGGTKLYQDRSYHFVQSVGQAQRLMKIYLLRNRQKVSCTIKCNAKALRNVPTDVIQLTFPAMGWANKYFEIAEIRHSLASEEGQPPHVTWEMDLLETDPSIYTWSTAEERTVLNTNSPTLYAANLQVAAPSGLTLTSSIATALVSAEGVVTPRILATWTQPDDTFTTTGGSILLQVQKVGDTSWSTYGILRGTATQAYIDGVIGGQQYNVQIAAMHASGAQSDWLAVGPITASNDKSSYTSSTILNNLGSVTPSQPIVISYTTTKNSCTFTWASQSVLRADGSTLTVPSGTLAYSGLASSTTYYTYWYINATSGALGQTNATPPATSPSAVLATQCAADGRIAVGVIAITTLAATNGGLGGGTGGGGDTCPEQAELVEVEGKGQIAAGDVQIGDLIKGYSFKTQADVYRRVVQVRTQSCTAWRMIDGHRVSPCEAVYADGQWMPAFRVSGATVDTMNGIKVMLSVESDEHDEQNYWLVGGNALLIHNMNVVNAC